MGENEKYAVLSRFLQRFLNLTFSDLNLEDDSVRDYLVAMLVRFIRTERLYRIQELPSVKLESVIESLSEVESEMVEKEDFRRSDEIVIRQQIADYTLFMSGLFREFVQSRGFFNYYLMEGGRSYLRVYHYTYRELGKEAAVFEKLGRKFEAYAGSLDYLKKVYFYYPEIDDSLRTMLSRILN